MQTRWNREPANQPSTSRVDRSIRSLDTTHPLSPRMMYLNSTFFRCAILLLVYCLLLPAAVVLLCCCCVLRIEEGRKEAAACPVLLLLLLLLLLLWLVRAWLTV